MAKNTKNTKKKELKNHKAIHSPLPLSLCQILTSLVTALQDCSVQTTPYAGSHQKPHFDPSRGRARSLAPCRARFHSFIHSLLLLSPFWILLVNPNCPLSVTPSIPSPLALSLSLALHSTSIPSGLGWSISQNRTNDIRLSITCQVCDAVHHNNTTVLL